MLKVKKLTEDAQIPLRSSGNAGYDLHSCISYTFRPGERKLIPTGIAIAIGEDCYGRVASRSSMGVKGFDVGAGVCDSTFRGQIMVLLINNNGTELSIDKGDRIAQLILERIYTPEVEVVEELPSSERGEKGFGSTGK